MDSANTGTHRFSRPPWFAGQRIAATAWLILASIPLAQAGDSLGDALTGGRANLDLRYRLEIVEQEGFSEDAQASTLRLRLGYTTGAYHGFFAGADFEHIARVGGEEYNSTENGLVQFPAVADPEDTEINQAYLGYSGLSDTVFKLGRQRIALDNHRFVGNVGWRQNEQTFDAFSVRSEVNERVTFFYGHLNNANTVFGESHPTRADLNLSSDLGNVAIRIPGGQVTAYAYLVETEDTPAASHKSLGVRYKGKHSFSDDLDLLYTAEYADQSDYKDGASTIDASYLLAEAGIRWKSLTPKLGCEVLGSNDGVYGFATPLATLHAFNGWADLFLTTPAQGLKDRYVSVAGTVLGFQLSGIYHDFSADKGGEDFGSELDLQIRRTFRKKYSFALKYADFQADSGSHPNTEKLWLVLQLKI